MVRHFPVLHFPDPAIPCEVVRHIFQSCIFRSCIFSRPDELTEKFRNIKPDGVVGGKYAFCCKFLQGCLCKKISAEKLHKLWQ